MRSKFCRLRSGGTDLIVADHRALIRIVSSVVAALLVAPTAPYSAGAASNVRVIATFAPDNRHEENWTVPPGGAYPTSMLALGPDGALYGMTSYGGRPVDAFGEGCGTIFRLAPKSRPNRAWRLKVLYRFQRGNGCHPWHYGGGHPFIDENGVLYGTARLGGRNDRGTAYSLTPGPNGWTFRRIAHGAGGPGQVDYGLVAGADGVLYGIDLHTIYSLTWNPDLQKWKRKVLNEDGIGEIVGIIVGPDGAIYGTARSDGIDQHKGYVFKLAPGADANAPWTMTVLHVFNGTDGLNPGGRLTFDQNGVLYGTTQGGGPDVNSRGTVFTLAPPEAEGEPWTHTRIFTFYTHLGAQDPTGGVLIGPQGELYGMTDGAVYRLRPPLPGKKRWKFTKLVNLREEVEGISFGTLIFGPDGALYGTSPTGGPLGGGTVFRVVP